MQTLLPPDDLSHREVSKHSKQLPPDRTTSHSGIAGGQTGAKVMLPAVAVAGEFGRLCLQGRLGWNYREEAGGGCQGCLSVKGSKARGRGRASLRVTAGMQDLPILLSHTPSPFSTSQVQLHLPCRHNSHTMPSFSSLASLSPAHLHNDW